MRRLREDHPNFVGLEEGVGETVREGTCWRRQMYQACLQLRSCYKRRSSYVGLRSLSFSPLMSCSVQLALLKGRSALRYPEGRAIDINTVCTVLSMAELYRKGSNYSATWRLTAIANYGSNVQSIYGATRIEADFLRSNSSAKPRLEFFFFFGAVIRTFTVVRP